MVWGDRPHGRSMKPSLRSKGFFGRPRRSRPAPCCLWLSHSASRLIQLVGRVDQDSHCEGRASSWSSSILASFRSCALRRDGPVLRAAGRDSSSRATRKAALSLSTTPASGKSLEPPKRLDELTSNFRLSDFTVVYSEHAKNRVARLRVVES